MRKVAILQSNYIPWKGYFDIINSVDEFIFHDDLQYTKNDWRNRNKIKTANGTIWLTIPCGSNEKRLINEVEISDFSWQKKHWNLIQYSYSKAKYWNEYKSFFEDFYLREQWENLSELNQYLILKISKEILGIKTTFSNSTAYNLINKKMERVVELLKKSNADWYLSGPAAKSYLSEEVLRKENIDIAWMDYSDYPEYNQLYPPFEHNVSILDLIFNCGKDTTKYMKSF